VPVVDLLTYLLQTQDTLESYRVAGQKTEPLRGCQGDGSPVTLLNTGGTILLYQFVYKSDFKIIKYGKFKMLIVLLL
jgi:hypothetical protein